MVEESSLTKSNYIHLTSNVIEDSSNPGAQSSQKLVSNEDIINAISLNYEEIIKENKELVDFVVKDKFYLRRVPNITLSEYITYILEHTNINISTIIIAIIYIDMFCEKYKYVLCFNNIYLMFLTACLLSIKFNEDKYISSEFYAEICEIPVEYLNELEKYLCLKLRYSLYVKDTEYNSYYNYLANYIPEKKAKEEMDA